MKQANPNDKNKTMNKQLFCGYLVTLIVVQAVGLVFLFRNPTILLAVVTAVTLGLLVPLFLGLILILLVKGLRKHQ